MTTIVITKEKFEAELESSFMAGAKHAMENIAPQALLSLEEKMAARSTPKQGEVSDWESRAELAEQQVISLSEERDFMREKLGQEQAEAREIRRILCAAYAGGRAYMDDGEAQDNREHPCIDFLRLSPPAIRAAMQARALKAAAPSPSVEPAKTLRDRLQQRCSDWGVYWRASDAHGVDLSHEQALELLRDALGVEVEIAPPLQQVEPGWVRATDRTPSTDRRVIIIYRSKNGHREQMYARFSGGEWRFTDRPPNRVMLSERVSHWMEPVPLPAAPKEPKP